MSNRAAVSFIFLSLRLRPSYFQAFIIFPVSVEFLRSNQIFGCDDCCFCFSPGKYDYLGQSSADLFLSHTPFIGSMSHHHHHHQGHHSRMMTSSSVAAAAQNSFASSGYGSFAIGAEGFESSRAINTGANQNSNCG